MIEYDFITYLESDAILQTYLGSSANDRRMYPLLGNPEISAPYIIFSTAVGTLDENLDEDRLEIKINAGLSKALQANIRDRIKKLLDKQDEIQGIVTSLTYWIYYCKLTASMEYIDKDTNEYIEILYFNIKYRAKQI